MQHHTGLSFQSFVFLDRVVVLSLDSVIYCFSPLSIFFLFSLSVFFFLLLLFSFFWFHMLQCCRCCCFIFCVGLLRYYHCLSCYSFLLHVGGVLSLLLLEVLLSSLNKYPLDLFVFSLRFRFLPCLKWHRLCCCYLPLVLCIQMTFFASSLFD